MSQQVVISRRIYIFLTEYGEIRTNKVNRRTWTHYMQVDAEALACICPFVAYTAS